MRKIYLLLGDEQKGPYSEEEVREMYVAGTVNPETLHWKDDMVDWQALGERHPGEPKPPVRTIAPPRRTDRPGRYSTEHKPVKSEEQIEEEDGMSDRIRPATVFRTVAFIIVFFVVLTGVVKVFGHSMPDISKMFANRVARASSSP